MRSERGLSTILTVCTVKWYKPVLGTCLSTAAVQYLVHTSYFCTRHVRTEFGLFTHCFFLFSSYVRVRDRQTDGRARPAMRSIRTATKQLLLQIVGLHSTRYMFIQDYPLFWTGCYWTETVSDRVLVYCALQRPAQRADRVVCVLSCVLEFVVKWSRRNVIIGQCWRSINQRHCHPPGRPACIRDPAWVGCSFQSPVRPHRRQLLEITARGGDCYFQFYPPSLLSLLLPSLLLLRLLPSFLS